MNTEYRDDYIKDIFGLVVEENGVTQINPDAVMDGLYDCFDEGYASGLTAGRDASGKSAAFSNGMGLGFVLGMAGMAAIFVAGDWIVKKWRKRK